MDRGERDEVMLKAEDVGSGPTVSNLKGHRKLQQRESSGQLRAVSGSLT